VNCFEACHLVGRHRMVFEDVRRVEFGVCHAISKPHTTCLLASGGFRVLFAVSAS
jgi:hypothetical protein